MGSEMVSCEDQYQKFPQINRKEVLELMKWQNTQPHLPTVTGTLEKFQYFLFIGCLQFS